MIQKREGTPGPLRRPLARVAGRSLACGLGAAAVIALGAGVVVGASRGAVDTATPAIRVPVLAIAERSTTPRFTEVAGTGLPVAQRVRGCSGNVLGAAWEDVDGDGRQDLYLLEPAGTGKLLLARSPARGRPRWRAVGTMPAVHGGTAAAFGDYDNDGRPDLYVAARGRDALLHNDGGGKFRDVTRRAGIDDRLPGASVAWADVDRDGRLDLYVTIGDNCSKPRPTPDRLYRNGGAGRFVDETASLHVGGATTDGVGLQAAWVDVDEDGDADLLLANDHLGFRANQVWRNDSIASTGLRFTPWPAGAGAQPEMSSMGIGIGDLDGDARLDFVISDLGQPPLALLRRGNGWTWRRLPAAEDRRAPIGWGVLVADVDNDADADVLTAAGALARDDAGSQPNLLHVGDGHGAFREAAAEAGIADSGRGRGLAVADVNDDGRLDVLITRHGQAPQLFVNRSDRRAHWIELDLRGTASPRDPCGATVIFTTTNRRIVRSLSCGSDGGGSSQHVVHAGLGTATDADVEIRWPSGARQLLRRLDGDERHRITEAG